MSDRLLVLVRHGQSEWNLKNLFTGWKDPDLTEKGRAEAKDAGSKLKAQGFGPQLLAALFHPDTPNDVAPGGFNAVEPAAGLPVSPLTLTPRTTGFAVK